MKSYFKAGHGRCKVAIELDEWKKVVIFELKGSNIVPEHANDADMGLKQILQKEYDKVVSAKR